MRRHFDWDAGMRLLQRPRAGPTLLLRNCYLAAKNRRRGADTNSLLPKYAVFCAMWECGLEAPFPHVVAKSLLLSALSTVIA